MNDHLYFLDFLKEGQELEFALLSDNYFITENFLFFKYDDELQIISLDKNLTYSINKFGNPRFYILYPENIKEVIIPGINYLFLYRLKEYYPDIDFFGIFFNQDDLFNKLKDLNNLGYHIEDLNKLNLIYIENLTEEFFNKIQKNIIYLNKYYIHEFQKIYNNPKKFLFYKHLKFSLIPEKSTIYTQDIFLNKIYYEL